MTYQEQLIAESKRFHENLDKGCWHDTPDYDSMQSAWMRCSKCGQQSEEHTDIDSRTVTVIPPMNPTYDNPAVIRAEMGDKWDGFACWHDSEIYLTRVLIPFKGGYTLSYDTEWVESMARADILTDPLLLMQAANSYMERVKPA